MLDGVRTTILVTGDYDLTSTCFFIFFRLFSFPSSELQGRSELGGVRTTVLATGDYDVEQVDGHGGAKF